MKERLERRRRKVQHLFDGVGILNFGGGRKMKVAIDSIFMLCSALLCRNGIGLD